MDVPGLKGGGKSQHSEKNQQQTVSSRKLLQFRFEHACTQF